MRLLSLILGGILAMAHPQVGALPPRWSVLDCLVGSCLSGQPGSVETSSRPDIPSKNIDLPRVNENSLGSSSLVQLSGIKEPASTGVELKSESEAPYQPFDELDNDVIHHIARQLPVKSLAKFRTVAKPFQTLDVRLEELFARKHAHLFAFKNPFLLYRFCISEHVALIPHYYPSVIECLQDAETEFMHHSSLDKSTSIPEWNRVKIQILYDVLSNQFDTFIYGSSPMYWQLCHYLMDEASTWTVNQRRSVLFYIFRNSLHSITVEQNFLLSVWKSFCSNHFQQSDLIHATKIPLNECLQAASILTELASSGRDGVLIKLDIDPESPSFKLQDTIRLETHQWLCTQIGNWDVSAVLTHADRIDPNTRDVNGRTALMVALHQYAEGHLEALAVIRILLDLGADVNFCDFYSRTALRFAHDIQMATLLLERGADPNIRDWEKNTLLIHYIFPGQNIVNRRGFGFIQLLLLHGANANLRGASDRVALALAINRGVPEVALLLLNNGADPNIKTDIAVCGALMQAICGNMTQVALLALAKGADPNAKDSYGNTPLMMAVRWDNLPVIEALLVRIANIDERNRLGETALMAAAGNSFVSNPDVARLLLLHHANASLRNNAGKSPYDIAKDNLAFWAARTYITPELQLIGDLFEEAES